MQTRTSQSITSTAVFEIGKGVGETLLVRNDTDYRDRKCFFCGKPGHLAEECRSAAYQQGIGKSVRGEDEWERVKGGLLGSIPG